MDSDYNDLDLEFDPKVCCIFLKTQWENMSIIIVGWEMVDTNISDDTEDRIHHRYD